MRIAIGWQNTITNEILLGMPYENEDEYKESKITGKKSGHSVHLRSFKSFVAFFEKIFFTNPFNFTTKFSASSILHCFGSLCLRCSLLLVCLSLVCC